MNALKALSRTESKYGITFNTVCPAAVLTERLLSLLAGLQECTADLKRHWNADGEKNGALSTGAQGDVRSIFKLEDYPSEASSRDQQGSGRFLLLIDERGGVAGCQVLEASVPALDARGCQVIRERAKFTPAVDRSGKPVRSTFVTPRITWQLGD